MTGTFELAFAEKVKFAAAGGPLPPVIEKLLLEAVEAKANSARAESLLWTAQVIDPTCLQVYFALYKFYFHRRRLDDAERAACLALRAAADKGGFDPTWETATPSTADWSNALGPQHFYLFSLKALAFIRLRQHRPEESRALLHKLQELDPEDSVGHSVIRGLAEQV